MPPPWFRRACKPLLRKNRQPDFERASSWYLVLSLIVLLTGCGDHEQDNSSSPTVDDQSITQEKERGPVKVSLRVAPKEPTFADRINYTITVESEPNVDVTMPSPGQGLSAPEGSLDLTKFLIRDFQAHPEEKLPTGNVARTHSYVLEVLTSGEFTIPPTTIAFIDRRGETQDDGDTLQDPQPAHGEEESSADPPDEPSKEEVFKLLTDPITFQVKGLEEPATLEELAPIDGPAEPPLVPPSLKWPLVALGSVVGLAIVGVLLWKLTRRPPKPTPPIPAEEIAYQEFEWLVQQGFVDSGELKEFFFHLSRIVREYIERRFGLRAPESTTEEFLDELARSDLLVDAHKQILKRFLEKADMVKFAKYAPETNEITASFEAARDFVAETRPQQDEEVTVSGSR